MSFDPAQPEIRPFDAGDLEEVLALAATVRGAPQWPRTRYKELLPGGCLSPGQSRPSRMALVARSVRFQESLGFVVASLIPPEAELESIAVASRVQRSGVGRCLLTSLVTHLRTSGIHELHLEVRASNRRAIDFYLAQNFRQTGVRRGYYADPEEDAVLMALHLE